MAAARAILHIIEARGMAGMQNVPISPISLELAPGDLALIDARDARRAAWFADLACGLVPLAAGSVHFLGRDWTTVPPHFAAALRGRIGRVFAAGGWVDFLDMTANVLLPQLHHTRREIAELREAAARLARGFGLPGMPLAYPRDLSPLDLARAACVRAFIGDPDLLLLESPIQGRHGDFMTSLLDALTAARQKGAAAIWLTGSDVVWGDRSFPATHRLHLRDRGLEPVRRAA